MLTVDTSSRPPSTQSTASREHYFYALTTPSIVPPPHVAIGNGYDSNSTSTSTAPFRKGHRKTESDVNAGPSTRRMARPTGYASDSGRNHGLQGAGQVPQFHRPLFLSRPSEKTTESSDAESYSKPEGKLMKKKSLRLKDINRLQVPAVRGSEGSGSESDITRISDFLRHEVSSATSTFATTSGPENTDSSLKAVQRPTAIRSSLWAISRRSVEGLFPKDELGPRGQGSVEPSDSPRLQNPIAIEAKPRSTRSSPPPAPLFLPAMLPERNSIYMTPAKALALRKIADRSSTLDWPDFCRPPVDPRDVNSLYSDSPEVPRWTIPPAVDDDVVVYSPPPRTPSSLRPSMPSTPRLAPTTSMSRPRRSSEATAGSGILKTQEMLQSLGLVGAVFGNSNAPRRDSIPSFYPLLKVASRSTDSLSLLKTNDLPAGAGFRSAPLSDAVVPILPPIKPATTPGEPHRPYQADYSRHWTPKRATTVPLTNNVARSPAVTLLQAMALNIPAEMAELKDVEVNKESKLPAQVSKNEEKGQEVTSALPFPQLQRKDFHANSPSSVDLVKELERRLAKSSLTASEKPSELHLTAVSHDNAQEARRSRKFSLSADRPVALPMSSPDPPASLESKPTKFPSPGNRLVGPTIQVSEPEVDGSVEVGRGHSRRPSLSTTESHSESPIISTHAVHEVERRLKKPSFSTSERVGDSPAVAALRSVPVRQSPTLQIQSSSATPLLYAISVDSQDVPPLPQPPSPLKGSPIEPPVLPTKIEIAEFIPPESLDRPIVRPPAKMPLSLRSPSTENIKTRTFPIAAPEPPPEISRANKEAISNIGQISLETTRAQAVPIFPPDLSSNSGVNSNSRKKMKSASKDSNVPPYHRPLVSHSRSDSQENSSPILSKLTEPQGATLAPNYRFPPGLNPRPLVPPYSRSIAAASPVPSLDKALPHPGRRAIPTTDEEPDRGAMQKFLPDQTTTIIPEPFAGPMKPPSSRSPLSRTGPSSSPITNTSALKKATFGATLAPPDIWLGKPDDLSESDRSGSKDSRRTAERDVGWGRPTESPLIKRNAELPNESSSGLFPPSTLRPDHNRPLAQVNHQMSATSSPMVPSSQRRQLLKENDPARSNGSSSHARPEPRGGLSDRTVDPIPQVVSPPPPPPSGSSKPSRELRTLTKSHGVSSPAVPPKPLIQTTEGGAVSNHPSHRHHPNLARQSVEYDSREQDSRPSGVPYRSAPNQLVPPSSYTQSRNPTRESPLPSRDSPTPPALPTRRQERHHRNGLAQPAPELIPPSHNQLKNLMGLSRSSPSPTPAILHKPTPPPKSGKSSKYDVSDTLQPGNPSHGHRKGHGGGGGSSSSLPRAPSPAQESMPDSFPSADEKIIAPATPPKKTHIFAFWKKTEAPSKVPVPAVSTKSQNPTTSRSKTRPPNPPTPTPPRESPILDHRRNVEAARARSPVVAPSTTASRKHHPPEKKQEKGILKMFGGGKRAQRTASTTSVEAVLGASNNTPGSPATIPTIPSHSPRWEDKALAVQNWRKQDANVQTHRTRRPRPGVTWELPAGVESLPGSPTTAVAIETIIDRLGTAR